MRTVFSLLSFVKCLLPAALLLLAHGTTAAPKAELWPFWQPKAVVDTAHAQPSMDAWQAFLNTYVSPDADGVNRVAYGEVTQDDKDRLRKQLDALAGLDPREWPELEQQAFWINTYNMAVVNLVLNHYPLESIKDIRLSFKSLFNAGPWEDKVLVVAGEKLSLNDIEHRILRPIWNDARFHFALNCASIGCPNLSAEVYRADTLDAQLEQAQSEFLQSSRAFAESGDGYRVSSIFNWYWQDFAPEKKQLWRYFQKQGLIDREVERFRYDYDWRLNDKATLNEE
ncbi:DUF547 domain-containing protein [Pseudoteredinibacter isoporae]|uniref:DUF547 domain-containing protein n=1 Tax=Pseudoteredinibacter isoporae TaxID=570281 RepID=A0A7X0JWW0_9GAMM|nr:DUF547 domain-containing protein [Pseudoteredinibacter isoporae]MBB6523734.1 hypothetical protein [Pseudoteredinibacter isoporae]NHO89236.1 DUF547 domain-containing protein [Pseudoteredinibacter isoporae]NIB22153.1 DUF547 domain-containing protein [Pseudoteredinibacter isoporae]